MISKQNEENNQSVNAFGYHIIRNELIKDLLGAEHDQLLYWAGKSLARRHKLNSVDEIIHFFQNVSWGHLEHKKETKTEIIFQLSPQMTNKDFLVCYQLEAGFLAEQIQVIKGCISETTISTKKNTVIFTVLSDKKDVI